MYHADNYTGANHILNRQVISKNRFIFSMQRSFQNLTSCKVKEKDGLHDHVLFYFFKSKRCCVVRLVRNWEILETRIKAVLELVATNWCRLNYALE